MRYRKFIWCINVISLIFLFYFMFENNTISEAYKGKDKIDVEYKQKLREKKYTINRLLIKYNKVARCKISKKILNSAKRVGRPLSRICITFKNGAYVIITYNDYNDMLFIDYQDESYNDSSLVPVLEDMIKAVNPKAKRKKFKKMWGKLRTGEYANYYGKQYKIAKFKINYSANKINNGQIRYSIKTEYAL